MCTKGGCGLGIDEEKDCGPSLLRSSHCSCLAAWGCKRLSIGERRVEAHSVGGQFLRVWDQSERPELLETRRTHLGQTASIEGFLLLLGRRILTEAEGGVRTKAK